MMVVAFRRALRDCVVCRGSSEGGGGVRAAECRGEYRGTSLIRNTHLPRITVGL